MVEVQQRFDERFYYIKDHLGSIRVTIDQTNQVTAAQDYSAYGEIWRNLNSSTPGDRYKFTEKELDKETKYHYFGARFYDSFLGRWHSVDPMADKYHGWSPYTYGLNNPVMLVDPNGLYTVGTHTHDPESGKDIIKEETREYTIVGGQLVLKTTSTTAVVDGEGNIESITRQSSTQDAGAVYGATPWSPAPSTPGKPKNININETSAEFKAYVEGVANYKKDNANKSPIEDFAQENQNYLNRIGIMSYALNGIGITAKNILNKIFKYFPPAKRIFNYVLVADWVFYGIENARVETDPGKLIIKWKFEE